MNGRPAPLLVASEYQLFRAAMRTALEAEGDLCVVAEAEDGRAAVVEALSKAPALALLEAALPGDAYRVCTEIKSRAPEVRVVILVRTADPDTLARAMEAGADGIATTEIELSGLVRAVRHVLAGDAFVPTRMLSSLLRGVLRRDQQTEHGLRKFLLLTRREREVLELLVDGSDLSAVAEILVISPETARTHTHNVMKKLGVHSRLELVSFAVEHDLVGRAEQLLGVGARGGADVSSSRN